MKGFHSSPTLKAAWQLHKQNSGTVEEHHLEVSKPVLPCLLHLSSFQLDSDLQEIITDAKIL